MDLHGLCVDFTWDLHVKQVLLFLHAGAQFSNPGQLRPRVPVVPNTRPIVPGVGNGQLRPPTPVSVPGGTTVAQQLPMSSQANSQLGIGQQNAQGNTTSAGGPSGSQTTSNLLGQVNLMLI